LLKKNPPVKTEGFFVTIASIFAVGFWYGRARYAGGHSENVAGQAIPAKWHFNVARHVLG
jgi:hypothetical protein